MILQWASIVGPGLARETLPVKLSFRRGARVDGTLHLRVAPGVAPELQHLEPLVIERINTFFGYHAVARLAMRQGPLPPQQVRQAPAPPRPLEPEQADGLTRQVAAIADPALRAAIERLGKAVLGSPEPAGLRRR